MGSGMQDRGEKGRFGGSLNQSQVLTVAGEACGTRGGCAVTLFTDHPWLGLSSSPLERGDKNDFGVLWKYGILTYQ